MIIETFKAAENKQMLDSTPAADEWARFSCSGSGWGIFTKFKVKSRSIISAFFAKMSIIYKNYHNYWYNFRNIRTLLVTYYTTFANTIYQCLSLSSSPSSSSYFVVVIIFSSDISIKEMKIGSHGALHWGTSSVEIDFTTLRKYNNNPTTTK